MSVVDKTVGLHLSPQNFQLHEAGFQGGIKEDHEKLLSSIADNDVTLAEFFGEDEGKLFENHVSGWVPPGVVDLLKVVDIHHGEADGSPGGGCACALLSLS